MFIWADGFEEFDAESMKKWFEEQKRKYPPLPKGCLMKQSGDFETEVLECPVGYAIVKKGIYEWIKTDCGWALCEKKHTVKT